MIDKEKVKLMHKANYFSEKERKSIYINQFYRKDYIELYVLLTIFRVSIAMALIGILGICYQINFVKDLSSEVLIAYIIKFGGISVAVIAVYTVISYCLYRGRYQKASEKVKKWNIILKKMESFTKAEHRENN
ncbi:MAG: hypothetical protein ACI4C1_00135 [Lachnospiraceae bacterium]